MFVATRIEFDWKTGAVTSLLGYHYRGPVALLKGASKQQNDLAAQQTDLAKTQAQFYSTLMSSYATQFANQSSILSSLQKSFQPILDAGINQFGFDPAETAALRTQASEGTAQSYAQASKALGSQISAQSNNTSRYAPIASGGETYIPSGQTGEMEAELAVKAAQQESNQQLGITTAGYDIGRQNYLTAAGQLGGVASAYNPLGYAGTATGAGSSATAGLGTAFNSATEIQKLNAQASPWATVGGILGGVAGSFLGPIGGAIGGKVGSALGGAGGGGGGGTGETFNDMGTALGV